MSGSSTPRTMASAPKQMSSRLLTMKFMQRAANTSPQSPATPTSSTQTPYSEPSAKRRRVDASPQTTTPTISHEDSFADRAAISAALKAEAEAQARARARNMKEGCETEWILDLSLPTENGVNTGRKVNGHIVEDASDGAEQEDDIWTHQTTGRQTYGDFKRKQPKPPAKQEQDDEDLSSASDSDVESGRHSYQQTPVKHSRDNFTKSSNKRQPYNNYGSPLTSLGRDRNGPKQRHDQGNPKKKSRKSY